MRELIRGDDMEGGQEKGSTQSRGYTGGQFPKITFHPKYEVLAVDAANLDHGVFRPQDIKEQKKMADQKTIPYCCVWWAPISR